MVHTKEVSLLHASLTRRELIRKAAAAVGIPHVGQMTSRLDQTVETYSQKVRLFTQTFQYKGTSSSAHQFEGNVSGQRHNDWDVYFSQHPSEAPQNLANNLPNWWEYPNAERDLALVQGLGLKDARISIEWARVVPEQGKIDTKALDRYEQILSAVDNPMVTLLHFTLPEWIAQEGGWTYDQFDKHFQYFVQATQDRLGDKLKLVITNNEPSTIIEAQIASASWPPKKAQGLLGIAKAVQMMQRANAVAYEAIKKQNNDALVGSSHSVIWVAPHDDASEADKKAASDLNELTNFRLMQATTDNGNAADFIGVNEYTAYPVRSVNYATNTTFEEGTYNTIKTFPGHYEVVIPAGTLRADTGWPILPEYSVQSLKAVQEQFPDKPVIVTESGIADRDDTRGAFYHLVYQNAMHEAIQRGVRLRGSYAWGTVDNNEWLAGKTLKFGVVGIDEDTGQRHVRQSAKLLGEIATANQIDNETLLQKYVPTKLHDTARVIFSRIEQIAA